ncbi:MAG: molybdopterin-guanine dinucleotide biosynthesis protein B [Methanospirillum sp.]|nr:molybdopterin-guanine dinucleotide biosynthesis protein B [Methanospirillum sp.]
MRVVQFAGWSGTGKTTLIEQVIDAAAPELAVGVVKHLGGAHPFSLDPDRDTTRFYDRGARVVVGIDAEKGVGLHRGDTLFSALDRLSDSGCDLALVEGFKKEPFARVVIGDLPSERCVLRDPTAREVLGALDRFDEHHSPGGLLRECRARAGGAGGFECSGAMRTTGEIAGDRDTLGRLEAGLASAPGVVAAGLRGMVHAGQGTVVMALVACDPAGGLTAMSGLARAVGEGGAGGGCR